MNVKNSILLLIVIAGISTSYYILKKKSCAANAADSTQLIVGTSADFPPFSFIKDGEIVGFDIDLAHEICHRLNKKMELKDMPFDTLIPQLQLGKMHMIAAGMTATPERAERVNFTKPHLVGEPLVVITISKNPITSLKELNNKEVVVNEGYTADTYMSKQQGPVLKRLPTVADAFMALNSGRAYAFVTARNSVKTFFDQHGTDKYSMFVIPETSENSALVISKKFPELLQCVQQALDALEADGTLQALKVKWGLAS
jgi:ABC-type amino acid transport substrate-binding protein